MIIDLFECPKCGHKEELLHDGNVELGKSNGQICSCGGKMVKVPSLQSGKNPVKIEDYVEKHRGHLGFKVQESMRKERAGLTSGKFMFGGRKR